MMKNWTNAVMLLAVLSFFMLGAWIDEESTMLVTDDTYGNLLMAVMIIASILVMLLVIRHVLQHLDKSIYEKIAVMELAVWTVRPEDPLAQGLVRCRPIYAAPVMSWQESDGDTYRHCSPMLQEVYFCTNNPNLVRSGSALALQKIALVYRQQHLHVDSTVVFHGSSVVVEHHTAHLDHA